jgi:hypothetical protein
MLDISFAQMSKSKAENADPDTSTRMSSTLDTTAARAESAYRKTLGGFHCRGVILSQCALGYGQV